MILKKNQKITNKQGIIWGIIVGIIYTNATTREIVFSDLFWSDLSWNDLSYWISAYLGSLMGVLILPALIAGIATSGKKNRNKFGQFFVTITSILLFLVYLTLHVMPIE